MGDTNKRHGLVIDTSMIDLGRVIASQDHNLPEVRVQDPEMSPPPTEQDQNLPSEMEFPLSDAGGGAEAGPSSYRQVGPYIGGYPSSEDVTDPRDKGKKRAHPPESPKPDPNLKKQEKQHDARNVNSGVICGAQISDGFSGVALCTMM